jgi:valyl-tRNA synthetase
MEDYLFGNVTSALHDFWQHDLCDNYLEAIKPVMNGTDQDAKFASQCTLWLCLDYGLRLMHPLMPFVTEELWQRTPGYGVNLDKVYDSIMLAPYPLGNPSWKSQNAEESFKVVKNIVHCARSLRADYNLTPQQRPNFFLKCSTPQMVAICSAEQDDIATLCKAGTVTVLDNKPAPSGCAMHVMDETCQVNIELKGMVDFAAEIKKLEGKAGKLDPLIKVIENKKAKPAYEEKTPDKVKATNQTKLDKYLKEKADIFTAIEGFRKLL